MTENAFDIPKDLFADDRPIAGFEEDRLGFTGPAKAIARNILEFASPEGFVIGIEGPWGLGKSSLINLISTELANSARQPAIVNFSPWLISTREGLLNQLFRDLADAADTILDSSEEEKKSFVTRLKGLSRTAEKDRLGDLIDKYSAHLSLAGSAATLLGHIAIPGMGSAGSWLKGFGEDSQSLVSEKSLGDRRERIKQELRKLDRQIIIFIDDLDRLEPRDVGEVVRLVKAVADFPNVVYVLSYAREILSRSLKTAYGLNDDERYIDKIVQVTYAIPKPEDFALRQMFRDGISELFSNTIAEAREGADISAYTRLLAAIDHQGGKTLKSPRDVARALNALRLYAGANLENIDLADMVWLQLIRLRNARLYEWIESYVSNIGAMINFGGHVGESAKEKMRDDLVEIVKADLGHDDIDRTLYQFASILPGLEKGYDRDEYNQNRNAERKWQVLRGISLAALTPFIEKKRLGSPSHYRHYFAFADPENAFQEDDFRQFLSDLEDRPDHALEEFDQLCGTPDQNGRPKVRRLMSRLEAVDFTQMSDQQKETLCFAFSQSMDKAAIIAGKGDWGRYWDLEDGERLYIKIIETLDEPSEHFLRKVYGRGDALGWLAQLVRREFFAQDRYNEERSSSRAPSFSAEQLDLILHVYVDNVRGRPFEEVVASPELVDILYAWAQSYEGGFDAVKSWIAENIASDDVFLDMLLGMRGWSSTNSKVYYPIRRDTLTAFMDYDQAVERANQLEGAASESIQAKAKTVVHALEYGKDRER